MQTPIATVAQLAASIALPFIFSALGRPDLAVTGIAITIGMLLLWLRARLASAGHLAAGVLLIAVPPATSRHPASGRPAAPGVPRDMDRIRVMTAGRCMPGRRQGDDRADD